MNCSDNSGVDFQVKERKKKAGRRNMTFPLQAQILKADGGVRVFDDIEKSSF